MVQGSMQRQRKCSDSTNRRGGLEEDDCLSKVEADSVPPEVRDWLSMTFTRSAFTAAKRRDNDRVRFRSLVNVVRVGLSLDRMARRSSNSQTHLIPVHVIDVLKNVDDWSFDVFHLNQLSTGHALKYIANGLFLKYDIINKFKIDLATLDRFLMRLEEGYNKHNNPYHNVIHAADVAQTSHHFISQTGLVSWMTDLEILSVVFAALIHDFEHTGTTNQFHINTRSEMALLYNDKAVLENHHLRRAFQVLCKTENNILSNLRAEEYREFRSLVISIVFSTDMNEHGQQYKTLKYQLSKSPRQQLDRTVVLSWIVHCSDISHPAKQWSLHERWTGLLIEEFFRQGDEEKRLGLPVSPICDRKKTLVADTQIGFLTNIVIPSLDLLVAVIQRVMVLYGQQNESQRQSLDKSKQQQQHEPIKGTKGEIEDTKEEEQNKSLLGNQPIKECPMKEDGQYKITKHWLQCIQENNRNWIQRKETGWRSPMQSLENGECSQHLRDTGEKQIDSPSKKHPEGHNKDLHDTSSPGKDILIANSDRSSGIDQVSTASPATSTAASWLKNSTTNSSITVDTELQNTNVSSFTNSSLSNPSIADFSVISTSLQNVPSSSFSINSSICSNISNNSINKSSIHAIPVIDSTSVTSCISNSSANTYSQNCKATSYVESSSQKSSIPINSCSEVVMSTRCDSSSETSKLNDATKITVTSTAVSNTAKISDNHTTADKTRFSNKSTSAHRFRAAPNPILVSPLAYVHLPRTEAQSPRGTAALQRSQSLAASPASPGARRSRPQDRPPISPKPPLSAIKHAGLGARLVDSLTRAACSAKTLGSRSASVTSHSVAMTSSTCVTSSSTVTSSPCTKLPATNVMPQPVLSASSTVT